VNRDEELPTFTLQKYTVDIVETRPVGDTIITVSAEDKDLRVSKMTLKSYNAINKG